MPVKKKIVAKKKVVAKKVVVNKKAATPRIPVWVTHKMKSVGVPFVLLKVARHRSPHSCYCGDHALIKFKKEVVVWKAIKSKGDNLRKVRLIIPPGSKVIIHEKYSKARTNRALYIGDLHGYSQFRPSFKYVPWTFVEASIEEDSITNDCGSGIHFYFHAEQSAGR